MREGDANTCFYHQTVKDQRRRQVIRRIVRDDGVECDDAHDIEVEAVRYYQALFATGTTSQPESILQCIPQLVSDNDTLMSLPTLQEVKQAVWDLNPTSVAGPDGFLGSFYCRFWQVISLDVLKRQYMSFYWVFFCLARLLPHSLCLFLR